MSMSRAVSTVETWGRISPERCSQPFANFVYAPPSSVTSAASSGVWSTWVYVSICGPVRHTTGSLRATPRGSMATMS